TSGTTGKPKGVMIEHRGIVNLTRTESQYLKTSNKEYANYLWYYNYFFDGHVWEIYSPLINGHTLYLINDKNRLDTALLSKYCSDHKIDVAAIPPSLLDLADLTMLKIIVVAGEVTKLKTMEYYAKNNVNIINSYGPTEITVCSSVHKFNVGDSNTTIGQPLANTTAYVLDHNMRPVPIGAIGELYVGGEGVARGYLNRADLTKERFLPNPFQSADDKASGYNTRLYKTGDLVRFMSDGNLEYVGRNDFQVKIRGFRIELGEIEMNLLLHPEVRQVIINIQENNTEASKMLIAYYTSFKEITDAELQEHLSNYLPSYMIPSIYVRLETFPITDNGKIDRRLLPKFSSIQKQSKYTVPVTSLEIKLCEIYADVLGMEKGTVGIDDDFFKLGGDSISSINLISQIKIKTDLNLDIRDVFSKKTVRRLLSKVESEKYQCISPLNNSQSDKIIFMIHPGGGNSEVYKSLAAKLEDNYTCIGINSYLLNVKKDTYYLSEIAAFYLREILNLQNFTPKSNYMLLGWSIGGQIALEIAAQLEQLGANNITVYLLDTVLNDKLDNNSNNFNNIDHLLDQNFGIEEFLKATQAIFIQPISNILKKTKVKLFKALLADKDMKNDALLLKYNNVERVIKDMEQLELYEVSDCNHQNILTAENFIISQIENDNSSNCSRIK
ncbi:non-ribosomal peptide synthetase family protein, partial [Bacteroides ovatus]|uniref:non-ribosomal peptide synthetase family protein n=1 Tax=Bacteroides ovatus TaxID=28116 RepID=UPI000FEDCF78